MVSWCYKASAEDFRIKVTGFEARKEPDSSAPSVPDRSSWLFKCASIFEDISAYSRSADSILSLQTLHYRTLSCKKPLLGREKSKGTAAGFKPRISTLEIKIIYSIKSVVNPIFWEPIIKEIYLKDSSRVPDMIVSSQCVHLLVLLLNHEQCL